MTASPTPPCTSNGSLVNVVTGLADGGGNSGNGLTDAVSLSSGSATLGSKNATGSETATGSCTLTQRPMPPITPLTAPTASVTVAKATLDINAKARNPLPTARHAWARSPIPPAACRPATPWAAYWELISETGGTSLAGTVLSLTPATTM